MAKSIQQNGGAKKKGMVATLFEDLSIAQVIAGALAAATVFLLSSVIGVAGSLIGAAVGSVVSAVSSQIYKKMLSASADKLRDAAPGDAPLKQADPDETRLLNPVSSDKTHLIDVSKVDAGVTKVMGTDDVRYQAHANSQGQTVDPAVQRAHVRRHRKARVQRNVIIVSIVSALIAIVISAGLIHVFTAGQGIGEKTDPIFTATDTAQTKQEAASENKASTEKSSKESSTANTSVKEKASSSNNSSSSDSANSSDSSSSNGSNSSSGSESGSSNSGGSSSNSGSSSSGSNSGSSSSSGTASGSSSNGSSTGSGSSSNSSSSGGSASTESSNN